jgi:hypothetical protein
MSIENTLQTVTVRREDRQDMVIKNARYVTIATDEGFLYVIGENFQRAFKLDQVESFDTDEQAVEVASEPKPRYFEYADGRQRRIYTAYPNGEIRFNWANGVPRGLLSSDFTSVQALIDSPLTTEVQEA